MLAEQPVTLTRTASLLACLAVEAVWLTAALYLLSSALGDKTGVTTRATANVEVGRAH